MEEAPVLKDRACGSCTLCCKLMGIAELDKSRGAWCTHCEIGRGCGIYEDRPSACRDFYCGYLTWQDVGEHWFPARSKMVIAPEFDGERIVIHVDPARPNAWREQPFYRDLKKWAMIATRDLQQIVVSVGARTIVILPEEDVDLGIVSQDERIVIGEAFEQGRMRLRAMKIRADDPRLSGARAGAIYGNNPFS